MSSFKKEGVMISRNYSIAFTTCSMRKIEMQKLVTLYYEYQDWGKVRRICLQDNVLQQRTDRSSKLLYAELVSRLKFLEPEALSHSHSC